jgi:hypothetical protein
MVITHVAVALLVATPVALVLPAYAPAAAAGAVLGGLLPDLDLFVGTHRRTLHFPVLGSVAAVACVAVAAAAPSSVSVGVAVAAVGAALHAASDALGAGEELRPWERTNPNAVYDHLTGRWWRARYVVPYDGHPRDLLVAVVAAAPPLVVLGRGVRVVLGVGLVVALVYTLFRRRLVPYFESVV